jgi:hypothetical protein
MRLAKGECCAHDRHYEHRKMIQNLARGDGGTPSHWRICVRFFAQRWCRDSRAVRAADFTTVRLILGSALKKGTGLPGELLLRGPLGRISNL